MTTRRARIERLLDAKISAAEAQTDDEGEPLRAIDHLRMARSIVLLERSLLLEIELKRLEPEDLSDPVARDADIIDRLRKRLDARLAAESISAPALTPPEPQDPSELDDEIPSEADIEEQKNEAEGLPRDHGASRLLRDMIARRQRALEAQRAAPGRAGAPVRAPARALARVGAPRTRSKPRKAKPGSPRAKEISAKRSAAGKKGASKRWRAKGPRIS